MAAAQLDAEFSGVKWVGRMMYENVIGRGEGGGDLIWGE